MKDNFRRMAKDNFRRMATVPMALAAALLIGLMPAGPGSRAAEPANAPVPGGSPAAPTADSPDAAVPISRAERLVFLEPHLKDVRGPSLLRYGFVQNGAGQETQRDELRLDLRARPDGSCCVAAGRFEQDPKLQALPEIDGPEANPVILYFLERDVREMQRLTKGQQAYFRKRIRMSLAEGANIAQRTIRWHGRELPAQEVSVRPYVDDPNRQRFERYAGKQYLFVLAAVPGGVYQLRSVVPGAGPNDPPALEETMTLADSQQDQTSPASPSSKGGSR